MNFITSYSAIRNNQIFRDGQLLFSGNPSMPLEEFLRSAYDFLKPEYPKFYKMDQLSQLGFMASLALLKDRNLKEEYAPEKTAVVLSNASSSIETDKKYLQSTQQIASPSLFVYTLPNIVAAEISIHQRLKGEPAFFITEQFDPGFMVSYVNQVIHRGAESCIAGWIENNENAPDVFLYLVEKEKKNSSIEHTGETVAKLYNA